MQKLPFQIILISLLLTILSIVMHFITPSTIYESDANWEEKVTLHQEGDAFKVRPLTTNGTVFLHNITGLDIKASFFGLQFLLLFLSGISFGYYLQQFDFKPTLVYTGLFLYFLSIPILLAHVEPHHTWDDFWVFTLVPLGFTLVLKNRIWWSLPVFFLSVIARETTLIFIPIWAYLIYLSQKKQWKTAVLFPAVTVILFAIYRFIAFGFDTGSPQYKLLFNFENLSRSSDTIFSFTIALGMLLPVGVIHLIRNRDRQHDRIKFLRWGAIISWLGFTSATFLLAQARETRLFFPPYIFLIPATLLYIESQLPLIKQSFSGTKAKLLGFVLIVLAMVISWLLFPDFEYRAWKDGHRFFWGLHLAIVLGMIIVERKLKAVMKFR